VITNQVNQGVSISRNQGISIAQGQYIACMDSDDWSYPSRLEQQIDFMRKNPSVVICGTFIEICDENLEKLNNRIYPCTDRDIRRKLFRYSPFAHPSTMCRADVLKKVGGYDKELVAVEDYDLYFKMGKYGKFANIAKTLHKLRFSAQSLSQVKGRLIETTTLNVRMKAVNDYHYQMTYADRAYFYLQKFSMYLIPYRIKFYLFNWLRSL